MMYSFSVVYVGVLVNRIISCLWKKLELLITPRKEFVKYFCGQVRTLIFFIFFYCEKCVMLTISFFNFPQFETPSKCEFLITANLKAVDNFERDIWHQQNLLVDIIEN